MTSNAMRVPESCARCLYDKQAARTGDPLYLERVKRLIDARTPQDTSPYLTYLFNQIYTEMFGAPPSYAALRRRYNDLALEIAPRLRERITHSPDPLLTSLQYARIGNYIDFGAMQTVNDDEFLALFDQAQISERDQAVCLSLVSQCEKASSFLLICDNCGEIALDVLFAEQLKTRFPHLTLTALVRGGEVLNDAIADDALYVGLDRLARVVSSGTALAGTVYELLSDEARACLDEADVILAKGQGNYESMHGTGRHVFYSFLCKCDRFTSTFHVPRLTGMLLEEN